jgi:hypothetical protein
MTEKKDKPDVEHKTPLKQISEAALNADITKHLNLLPPGSTIGDITKQIRDSQTSSLIDTSLHEVLTIPANSGSHLINRMTFMTDERLDDDFYFKVHDVCGFKRFVNDEHKMMFENINNQVKESYMAMDGNFWNGLVAILAGRAPGEVGMFRSILGGFIQKLMNRDKDNNIK